LHRAVVYEGDMTRLGTASTKSRHEVRGSARKIRPQKGSGRARLGDKKSPMLRGGGLAFGPRPRNFASELQKKVYDLAWRTALSYRYRKGELIIVENAMEIESPSPRLLGDIFKHHERLCGRGRSLLVTLEERPLLQEALLDMDRGEQTLTWEEVDVKNLLELSRVIIEREALHNILLTHEEDLTHKALPRGHKSLIRSAPPADLETTIGWAEFRDLSLLQGYEREASRASAYESVASKRYAYASSLPASPQRTDLTTSAYTLLADAKALHFHKHTGMPFTADMTLITGEHPDPDAAQDFPRIQELSYKHSRKLEDAGKASYTTPIDGEALENEATAIEIEKLELQHKAAELAAQVLEHRAEAQRLAGEEELADGSIALASSERTTMDGLDMQILETRLALRKNEYRVMVARKESWVEMQKCQKDVARLEKEVARKKVEQQKLEAALSEEAETEAGLLEAPVVEIKAQEKR
jgi:large subunit ribosomal protein L4